METKKSRVKELKHFGTPDQYGNHSHVVTFENGDSGYCKTKDPDGVKYAVGKELDYEIEERTKKDGSGTYFVVRTPKPQNPYTPRPVGKGAKDYKAQAVFHALSEAVTIVNVNESVSMKEHFDGYFQFLKNTMYTEIDKLYAE